MSLTEGMPAPPFAGIDQNGNHIRLEDLRGKKVILYFYPKDDTPGCTKEACNLRDNYAALQEAGYTIIGVSADPIEVAQEVRRQIQPPLLAPRRPRKENHLGLPRLG